MLSLSAALGSRPPLRTASRLTRGFLLLCRKSAGQSSTASVVGKTVQTRLADHVSSLPSGTRKAVGWWLLGIAGATYGAISLGGYTRLTESGLSMVDWHLIKGMRPPRTQAEWQTKFDEYKTFPEYQYVTGPRDLSLSEFKRIWYTEYLHRMWGRTIGVAFYLPAAYFWLRGAFSGPMKKRVVLYGSILAFQGLLGWYMVRSGLEEKPDPQEVPRVSQFRLAAHLTTAMVLYTGCLWTGLSHLRFPNQIAPFPKWRAMRVGGHVAMTCAFITAVSGAFVAGLDAGLVYNSWPKMADRWIPTDIMALEPKWRNYFYNPTTVQFIHRRLGEATVLFTTGLWFYCRNTPIPKSARIALHHVLAMGLIQASLGVTALLTLIQKHIAVSHQAGAIAYLSTAIWFTHELRRVIK